MSNAHYKERIGSINGKKKQTKLAYISYKVWNSCNSLVGVNLGIMLTGATGPADMVNNLG